MIDQTQILIYNLKNYLSKKSVKTANMAIQLQINPQPLRNILNRSKEPSYAVLKRLAEVTNISLSEWFTPNAEIYGLITNDTYSGIDRQDNKVKVVFQKEDRFVEFNGNRLPTSDFDFSNISAKYGELCLSVDILIDGIEKRHVTADKG